MPDLMFGGDAGWGEVWWGLCCAEIGDEVGARYIYCIYIYKV